MDLSIWHRVIVKTNASGSYSVLLATEKCVCVCVCA